MQHTVGKQCYITVFPLVLRSIDNACYVACEYRYMKCCAQLGSVVLSMRTLQYNQIPALLAGAQDAQ